MDASASPHSTAPHSTAPAPHSTAPGPAAVHSPPHSAASESKPARAAPGRSARFRWIGIVGTIAAVAAAAVVGWRVFLHRPAAPVVVPHPTASIPRPPRIARIADGVLDVPAEVVRSLGLETDPARAADQPRALPPFQGLLAIDTNRLVRVHSPFSGEVVALGTPDKGETTSPTGDSGARALRLGDRVEKGQLLAVVWSKDFGEKKSELIDALSRRKLDTERLARYHNLGVDVIPQKDLREAEAALRTSENAVAKAEATLRVWRLPEPELKAIRIEAERLGTFQDRLELASKPNWARVELRSPLAGVVLEKNTSIGDVIDYTADLFKIADLSKLTAWAQVYEDDLPALQSVPAPIHWEVRLANRPGVVFPGVLEQIGAIIDVSQHTAPVSGSVDNPRDELRAGQFVTMVVKVPPQPGEVEVPTAGLIEDGETSVVFVQPDPKVHRYVRRQVDVVRRFYDVVYARGEGVKPGEEVVVRGAIQLKQALDDLEDEPLADPDSLASRR